MFKNWKLNILLFATLMISATFAFAEHDYDSLPIDYKFPVTFINNTGLNFIEFPSGQSGINALATPNPLKNDGGIEYYGSTGCTLIKNDDITATLNNGATTKNPTIISPYLDSNDRCKAVHEVQTKYSSLHNNKHGYNGGDFAYQFTTEAGQQSIMLFSAPSTFDPSLDPDNHQVWSWFNHWHVHDDSMRAGDATISMNYTYNYSNLDTPDEESEYFLVQQCNFYAGECTYDYNYIGQAVKGAKVTLQRKLADNIHGGTNFWQNSKDYEYDNALTLNYLYLGKYGADKTDPGLDIYKFTIHSADGIYWGGVHNQKEPGDLPSTDPNYEQLPRGQNFSIIFSPYEVEASADTMTWYHLGYVLPQGKPFADYSNSNYPNGKIMRPGDATFYVAPQKMTVPDNQLNAGAQFKYFKVRQWLRDKDIALDNGRKNNPTIITTDFIELPNNPIEPFLSVNGTPAITPNPSLKIDANAIAQSKITYAINGYSDTNTIKNPTDYAYFYTSEPTLGVALKSQAYLITNFYDPNDIAPLADDFRATNYPKINKNNYLAVTEFEGQYEYNPKANSALLQYNNSLKITGTFDPYTYYYVSSGRESNQSTGKVTINAMCAAVGARPQTTTITDSTNTAFNGTQSAFTAGELTVTDNSQGYTFNQKLNSVYALRVYSPTSNTPISYLFYDVNRNKKVDDTRDNDTLACDGIDTASCTKVVPYTVLMNKYLALVWMATNHTAVGEYYGGDGYSTGLVNPNPSYGGCDITIVNSDSFSTSECLKVKQDDPGRINDYVKSLSTWDWPYISDTTATADNAQKNLSATVTDTAGDVLVIINSHN